MKLKVRIHCTGNSDAKWPPEGVSLQRILQLCRRIILLSCFGCFPGRFGIGSGERSMGRSRKVYIILLVVYVVVLFCTAIVLRKPMDSELIMRDLFWGWHNTRQLLWSNIINIAAFVPVGFLIGMIVPRYKLLLASLAGMFLSETFECFQLILRRGVFDVDDLFNNVVGALIGGLIAVLIVFWNHRSHLR